MIEKEKYYKHFWTITDGEVNRLLAEELEQYDVIESINSDFDTMEEELYADTIDNTIGIILRIVLWDSLFKDTEYVYDERLFWGSNKKNKAISYLIPIVCEQTGKKNYPKTSKVLFSVFGRWPLMRDSLFCEQKEALLKCITEKDYSAYIKKNPYFEFLLFAKYRLSQLMNTTFVDAKIVIELFPESDILPIEEIRTLFQEVNGIQFMWRGKVSSSDVMKQIVVDLIAGFKQVQHGDGVFVHTSPIDYNLLNRVLDCFVKDNSFSQYAPLLYYEWYIHNITSVKKETGDIVSSIEFFQCLISLLNTLISGVRFMIPKLSVVLLLTQHKNGYFWATDDKDANKVVIIRSSDDRPFDISGNVYAGCFLMLNTHCG